MKGNIVLRVVLYSVILFLTPFGDEVVPVLKEGQWPTVQSLVATTIMAVVALAVGLRAYFDGSAERSRQQNGQAKPQTP